MIDERLTAPLERQDHYIDGRFVAAHGSGWIHLENPADRSSLGRVALGDDRDVDDAVAAAKRALPGWSRTTVGERADCFAAIAAGMRERQDDLAALISAEMGAPISLARDMHVGLGIAVYDYHVELVRRFAFEREAEGALVVLEPAGVAAAITPWNVSPFLIACKVAPALAAGCTVVLKPSEVTSLSALFFGEVLRDAGVPAGVVNIVTGDGLSTGDALVRHPDVAVVSFTGSGRAGEAITVAAAPLVKNVSLELGGKSASLIFDDADLEAAVVKTVTSAFTNAGQVCAALTRMVVHRSRYEEALELARREAARWLVGAPDEDGTRVGPVASAAQHEKVTGLIRTGIAEGARVIIGGAEAPDGFTEGCYVTPTILADVHPEATVAQEEIFGPVLAVIPFDDEEEAVRIANATRYGLSGAVWSGDEARAMRVARSVQSGTVSVNGRGGTLTAPFGGMKQSGRGREWGPAGLHEFLETKSLVR